MKATQAKRVWFPEVVSPALAAWWLALELIQKVSQQS
jgi:hypothetical protein